MTDPREHAARRKIWNRAFSSGALRQYEPLLRKRALQLCEELERRVRMAAAEPIRKGYVNGLGSDGEKGGRGNGVEIDLAKWLSYFSYVQFAFLLLLY